MSAFSESNVRKQIEKCLEKQMHLYKVLKRKGYDDAKINDVFTDAYFNMWKDNEHLHYKFREFKENQDGKAIQNS